MRRPRKRSENGAGTMANEPVLYDTNVWMDFFLHRSADKAKSVISLTGLLEERYAHIVITTSIKKDVFYNIQRDIKRQYRNARGTEKLPEDFALAARDLAWTMLEQMDELATIVPESMREDFFARHLRATHDDYEDDLLMGTAQAVDAQMVVTYDEALVSHFPRLCMTPRAALERLEA